MRTCFYCKASISDDDAEICPACGARLDAGQGISIPNAVKALVVVAICCIPFLGIMGGLIGGLALMRNNASEDYKTFGKAILILSAVLIILNVLFCALYGAILANIVYRATGNALFY